MTDPRTVTFECWAVLTGDGDWIEDHGLLWFTADSGVARSVARAQSRFEQFLAKPVRVRVTVEVIGEGE